MTHKNTSIQVADLTLAKDMLKGLSVQDFLNFGVNDVAYIREVVIDGKKAFGVHSADGGVLSVMETYDTAAAIISHSDLAPVSLH